MLDFRLNRLNARVESYMDALKPSSLEQDINELLNDDDLK